MGLNHSVSLIITNLILFSKIVFFLYDVVSFHNLNTLDSYFLGKQKTVTITAGEEGQKLNFDTEGKDRPTFVCFFLCRSVKIIIFFVWLFSKIVVENKICFIETFRVHQVLVKPPVYCV